MNCAHCNAVLEPGAKFCNNCGAPVETTPAQETLFVRDASAHQDLPSSGESPSTPQDLLSSEETPGELEEQALPYEPASQAYSRPEPAAYVPAGASTPPPAEEKVMGMEAKTFGLVSLGLGIAGIAFSCVGCGGLLSLLGLIAGVISLKTSGRQTGRIGMILSVIGLLVTLVFLCLYAFAYSYFDISRSVSY